MMGGLKLDSIGWGVSFLIIYLSGKQCCSPLSKISDCTIVKGLFFIFHINLFSFLFTVKTGGV